MKRIEKELAYYKSAAMKSCDPLEYVPAKVRILKYVAADHPAHEAQGYFINSGSYECKSNKHGAVSVRANNGWWLGLKLDEFEVIEWRKNNLEPTKPYMLETLYFEKSSIGVKPKKFWLEDRVADLKRACISRIEQGMQINIVHSWIDEIIELQTQLQAIEEKEVVSHV